MMDFKNILQSAKLKNTYPRMCVLEALSVKNKPVTAQEIFVLLKKKKIDLVTIYRTITSFEKVGIVKRVDLRQDAVLYELNTEHHHHIVCTICKIVEDFEMCEMETLSKKIVSRSHKFSVIKEHNFELFGICNSCIKA